MVINDFIMSWLPYWIFFLNANGHNFAHPQNLFVLDLYKLISVDRKSLYKNYFFLAIFFLANYKKFPDYKLKLTNVVTLSQLQVQ